MNLFSYNDKYHLVSLIDFAYVKNYLYRGFKSEVRKIEAV